MTNEQAKFLYWNSVDESDQTYIEKIEVITLALNDSYRRGVEDAAKIADTLAEVQWASGYLKGYCSNDPSKRIRALLDGEGK
jgi:hypothetical protein